MRERDQTTFGGMANGQVAAILRERVAAIVDGHDGVIRGVGRSSQWVPELGSCWIEFVQKCQMCLQSPISSLWGYI